MEFVGVLAVLYRMRPNGKKITVNTAEIPTSLQTADLATATDHLPVVLTVTIQ